MPSIRLRASLAAIAGGLLITASVAVTQFPISGAAFAGTAIQRIPNGEAVYPIAEVDQAPTLLYKEEPDYTEEARQAKISGKVTLGIEVDRDGRPTNVYVLEGLDGGLDRNAVLAIERWRFQPAMKEGQPVAVRARVEVNFRLQ